MDVIRALMGHANVHVNCGCGTSLEACMARLASEGFDVMDPLVTGVRNVSAEESDGKFDPYIHFTNSMTGVSPYEITGQRHD